MKKYCANCGTLLEDGECPKCGISYNNNGIIDRVKIKRKAREMLSKDLWVLLKPLLIIAVIEFVLFLLNSKLLPSRSYFGFPLTILENLVILPLNAGLMSYYLSYVRGKEFKLSDLFDFYDSKIFFVWGVSFLSAIFVMLWSLLFIIPGIIATFSYAMIFYITAENEETSCLDVIKRSKYMMQGYKYDYFVFNLSFIGWLLLGAFTYGIAYIYVMPYIQVSTTLYYEELKKIKS